VPEAKFPRTFIPDVFPSPMPNRPEVETASLNPRWADNIGVSGNPQVWGRTVVPLRLRVSAERRGILGTLRPGYHHNDNHNK
jgi:hypothetical protein